MVYIPTGGSSREFCAMGESLTQQRRVKDEILRDVNFASMGNYRDWETDRKSTRLNSSHSAKSRMPSSA